MSVLHPCKVGRPYITHVVDSELASQFRAEQSGILLHNVYIVIDKRHIHAAKSVDMTRRCYVKKAVGR